VATHDLTQPRAGDVRTGPHNAVRRATETKGAFKTTEFMAYVVTFVLILIAGQAIGGHDGGTDYFAANRVWLYITILTVGYMVSRGLAKSGSRDPYTDDSGDTSR
jgi:hypothetical protein